jgi:preprotein translocase subunit SecB
MEVKFHIPLIRLIEVHFSLNPQYKWGKNKPIPLENQVGIKFNQVENELHLLLSVSSDSDTQPFRFSVTYEGIFAFENMPVKDELERIAYINCAAIIFPYAREAIADMTRRAGLNPLNLPPFNFVALYREKQKTTSQEALKKTLKKRKA